MSAHGEMVDHGATRPEMGHGDMDRDRMLRAHQRKTLWVWWTVILLGAWVAVAPFTFGYGHVTVEPSGGREVWLSLGARVAAVRWSDVVSGVLLIGLGWRSLAPNRPYSMWAACLVGCWLTVAPVLFWCPSPAAYMNDTFAGMLVVSLTILVPGMPNMVAFMRMGGDTPNGWSYNPSSWPQRWIMIALGFAGFVVSRYLAAYQLGYIDHVWDPFFGDGSRRVLDSKMSHGWPISDASLGAIAYTFEFLMGFMGGTSRWRTMPWMVAIFGILVIPLGLTHIVLVISQPVVVGAWCTFCLLAASIMLPMLPLEADEVIAMGQHMIASKRKGHRMWDVFWKGGPADEATNDERSPSLMKLSDEPRSVLDASTWGMSVPWTLATTAVLGLVLVFAPAVLGFGKAAADVAQFGGLLAVTFSVIAMGEPLRALRFANIVVGLVVAILTWTIGDASVAAKLLVTVLTTVIALLSVRRGPKKERYGLWDRFVV
jgi:hypothetical protein